jgi:hypothetical protein
LSWSPRIEHLAVLAAISMKTREQAQQRRRVALMTLPHDRKEERGRARLSDGGAARPAPREGWTTQQFMFTPEGQTTHDSARNRGGVVTNQNLLPLGHHNPKTAFIAIRNYLAGQFVGATNDDDLLHELLKILFCKLYIEVGKASGDIFSNGVASARVIKAIKADFSDLFDKDDEILLSQRDASYVLSACQFPMVNEDADPIGDAFEVFSGSEARGKAGQFFTPRGVTDLLVDMVG